MLNFDIPAYLQLHVVKLGDVAHGHYGKHKYFGIDATHSAQRTPPSWSCDTLTLRRRRIIS